MEYSLRNTFLVLFVLFTSCGDIVKIVDNKLEVSKTRSLRRFDERLLKINQFLDTTDYNLDSIAIAPPLKLNDTMFVFNNRNTMDVTGVELYLSTSDPLSDTNGKYSVDVKVSANNTVLPGKIHLQNLSNSKVALNGFNIFPIAKQNGMLEIKFITVPDSGNCAHSIRPTGYVSLIRKGGPRMRGRLIKAYADLIPFYFDKKGRSGVILWRSWATYVHQSPSFPRYLNGEPYGAFIVLRNKAILFIRRDEDSNKIKINQLKQALPNIPDSIINDKRLITNNFWLE